MFFQQNFDKVKVFLEKPQIAGKISAALIALATLTVALLTNLYAPNHVQKFWCMGYAESLARSTPFSVYAETITLAPSPIAFGLPHVYLMSLFIRAGIDAYHAYDLVFILWGLLSMFCCYKICRLLTFGPIPASLLPLFYLALPAVVMHQGYSALGLGYLLIPFYVWSAMVVFKSETIKKKIAPAFLLLTALVIALFMDGYSFMMGLAVIGGVYLASFKRSNWRLHLFADTLIVAASCLIAYLLYSRFVGLSSFDSYPRRIFTLFQAKPSAYLFPLKNGFSVLGNYFSYTLPRPLEYFQDFLFCLPLLAANLILLAANGNSLFRRPAYWLLWFMILGAFWMSLGPDIVLSPGKSFPTGNWLIYKNLPGVKVMRATARWGILVNILLVVMLYVSLVKSKLKPVIIGIMLSAVYFLQYLPSPNYVSFMRRGLAAEGKTRKLLAKDLKGKLRKGETILFLPIRNSFSHLYLGTVHGANTWNTGCDKNTAMLVKAYPPEISPLAGNTYEVRYISRLSPVPAAMQIIKILLFTRVDAIVFDYNSICPIAEFPYRNLLKKDADAIEKVLQKTGFVTITHSKFFAYYRIDKSKLPSEPFPEMVSRIENTLLSQFAYSVDPTSALVTMDKLQNSSRGFYAPSQNGSWASTQAAIFLKVPKEWYASDRHLVVVLTLHNALKPQRVTIFSKGKQLISTTITSKRDLPVPISPQLLDENGTFSLEFKFPDALSPRGDSRVLSCFFHRILVETTPRKILLEQKISVNILGRFLKGFSFPEPEGRWCGKEGILNLPFAQNGKTLRLMFEGWPLTDDQFAVVKDEQKKILAFIPVPKAGEYSVVIPPRKGSQVDKLVLRFEFPQARRPNNGDQRVLSFFFRSIKLSQADGK